MKKIVTNIIISICLTFVSFAQELEGIPPAPTVSKFVTIEKDTINNIGQVVQKFNLWDIKVGNYNFPLEMIYSSSGVKVEEIPSYVGIGWNLSAGGVITRSVIDLPDDLIDNDLGKGILHTNIMNDVQTLKNNFDINGYSENTAQSFIKNKVNENIKDGIVNDTQPDIFYFNFFGHSGKFIFNKDKEIVSLQNDNLRFSYTLNILDGTLSSFSILDTNGILYTFTEREFSQTISKGSKAWEYLISRDKDKRDLDYYSSWHLKKVTVPGGGAINFEYENETLKYVIRGAVMGKICGTQQCDDGDPHLDILNQTEGTTTSFTILSKKVNRIYSEDLFDINFTNTTREDLEGGLKLDSFIIKNSVGTQVCKYNFIYDYFVSPEIPTTDNFEYKRLKLKSIKKNSSLFQEFEYYENYPLPHRKSFEQDFWGYYNKNNASSLVPKIYVDLSVNAQKRYHIFPPNNTAYSSFGNIIRDANKNYAHMGMLKSVKYNTGGKKIFHYEPNSFTHKDYTNSSKKFIYGNGVRLDRIDYFDGVNTETLDFDYNNPLTGISSGKVSYIPQFATHIPWNFVYDSEGDIHTIRSPKGFLVGYIIKFTEYNPYQSYICFSAIDGGAYNLSPNNKPSEYYSITTRRYSVSQIPLYSNIEGAFSYEYISMKDGANGQKEYHFDITGALDESVPSNLDISKFKKPISYGTYNWFLDDNSPFPDDRCGISNQIYQIGYEYLNIFVEYMDFLDLSGESHPFSPIPNWNRLFGSLKSYTYYNNNGFKVFKESYEYETIGDTKNFNNDKKVTSLNYRVYSRPWGTGYHFDGLKMLGPSTQNTLWIWSFVDTYYGIGISPSKINKTYYFNEESDVINNETQYLYQNGNLLSEIITKDSKGKTLKVKYRYPYEFSYSNLNGDNIYKKMLNNNLIGYPIETIEFVEEKVSSAIINSYSTGQINNNPNEISLKSKNFLKIDNPIDNYEFAFSEPTSIENWPELTLDSRIESKVIFDKYDKKGNISQYHIENGNTVTLLWGYNYSLLIAKVENASYEEVMLALNRDINDDLSFIQSYSEVELENFADELRAILNNSFVTSYIHIPLKGLKSTTNERGEKTSYRYDNNNRLRMILDSKGNVLKLYKYHYKN